MSGPEVRSSRCCDDMIADAPLNGKESVEAVQEPSKDAVSKASWERPFVKSQEGKGSLGFPTGIVTPMTNLR